jgi:Domain of unknown function (DUF4110)
LEQKDREITLNDMWSLNLDKMNEWNQIISDNHLTSEWFESSDEDTSDEDNSDEEDEETDSQSVSANASNRTSTVEAPVSASLSSVAAAPEPISVQVPDPLPAEMLAAYFTRTQLEWQLYAQQETESMRTGKALRRDAFELAQ